MRIYIVEDDTSVIGILEDIVEGNELGVVCGDSGGEPRIWDRSWPWTPTWSWWTC